LITSPEERERVARLNLVAGRRAKTSTAYASALQYLAAGRRLLGEESWDAHYELTFEIECDMAECEFLTGALAEADRRLLELSDRARTTVERAAVACLRIDVYTALGRSERAVTVALGYLRTAGIDWAPHPTDEDTRREYERVWNTLGDRTIEALIDLP